jgi:hypothetical protein
MGNSASNGGDAAAVATNAQAGPKIGFFRRGAPPPAEDVAAAQLPRDPGSKKPWVSQEVHERRNQQYADAVAAQTGAEMYTQIEQYDRTIADTKLRAEAQLGNALDARARGDDDEAVYYMELYGADQRQIKNLRQMQLAVQLSARNMEYVHRQAGLLKAQQSQAEFVRVQLQRNAGIRTALTDDGEADNEQSNEELQKLDAVVVESINRTRVLFDQRQSELANSDVGAVGDTNDKMLAQLDEMLAQRAAEQHLAAPPPPMSSSKKRTTATAPPVRQRERAHLVGGGVASAASSVLSGRPIVQQPQRYKASVPLVLDGDDSDDGDDDGNGGESAAIRAPPPPQRRQQQQRRQAVQQASEGEDDEDERQPLPAMTV